MYEYMHIVPSAMMMNLKGTVPREREKTELQITSLTSKKRDGLKKVYFSACMFVTSRCISNFHLTERVTMLKKIFAI